MKIIETINKQIDWYYKNSTTASLTAIAELHDKLSSNLYFLMEEYDNAHKDFISKYTNYKRKRGEWFLKTKYGTTEKKMTEKEIESIMDRDTATEFWDRLFAEAYLDTMKERIGAIKAVLRAIDSRLSVARAEFYNTKK